MVAGFRGVLVAASLLVVAFLAGCGESGATRFSGIGPVNPGGGGTLDIAVPVDPEVPDPLNASGVSAELAARQVYEPLVAKVPAPYERKGSEQGLALSWRHSGDFRVWSFVLRDRVAFQDGASLDGAAVVANADRWRTDPIGQVALPGLIAADSPSPDTVRFILNRAAKRLPAELGDARLGLVSPTALDAAGGGALPLSPKGGTGPFEQTSDDPAVLVRNVDWWGSDVGLGPALDEIHFRSTPAEAGRAALLHSGDVRVAVGLSTAGAGVVEDDPLLAAFRGEGEDRSLGIQRSVRGIRSAAPIPLSSVWLSVLGGGAG